MNKTFVLDDRRLSLEEVMDFSFRRQAYAGVQLGEALRPKIDRAYHHLMGLMERRVPIYGVTTGFGDSSFRVIDQEHSFELQKNLVNYLSCATGPILPEEASRAAFLIRLRSLSRGYSGVSYELIERMRLFLEKNWIPVIPRQGSLGASGDLIPLAYIAQILQGQGMIHSPAGPTPVLPLMKAAGVSPYLLKPKEGLALVNGTSAMAGLCLLNLRLSESLLENAVTATAWLCMALRGRTEAFGQLVNEKANTHVGQSRIAAKVRTLLEEEGYQPKAGQDIGVRGNQTEENIQDRYSLRCMPQVLGPVQETIQQVRQWLETEINSTSDNPLIDEDGKLGMGGNFYGGYLGQGMDYLKISLAHLADLMDRQLMTVIDEKSNRGLPPNLADWNSIPESERHMHHGLKGLHQAVNAITAEVLAKAMPNGIFSRSSESHNQDKVSLGMSAAVQGGEMIESLYTIQAMVLICLAQALDLRGVKLSGGASRKTYSLIREFVPFIKRDTALDENIRKLAGAMRERALGGT